jgi:hypothetical protein
MSDAMTVAAMLQTLRGQMEEHRTQEAFHAEQESHHRQERARHAAELEQVTQRYEALETAVTGAKQVLRIPEPAAPRLPDDSDLGEQVKASRALARVLAAWPAGVAFGASAIAAEVNRRFARKLPRPLDSRAASLYLRRRSREGAIDTLQEGRAYHEALYRKPG